MNRVSNSGITKSQNGNTQVKNQNSTSSNDDHKGVKQQQEAATTPLLANPMVQSNESIKLVAETVGIANLTDEATKELAFDLSFIVKSILLDAQKFARKSRRKKIIPSDIDYSLKARSLEPIYGFSSVDGQVPYRCATSTGGNGGSGRSIFYSDEQIIDLIDLISINNTSVKIPNDFAIHAHWLAIEGVQPSVPENPQLVTREMQKLEAEGLAVRNQLKESQLKLQSNQQKKSNNENFVKLKSLIPHDLSVEQQIYFKEVTEACVGSDEQKRTEALNSLETDPGLHQLLPRIILFIAEGVRLNIIQQNMAILIYLMRMAKSLSENKSIYLEKYLHELLPSILSCVLSKQVCGRPEVDNHCALREFCARLVGQIIKTYRPTIPSLQTRIIKIYLNSIESDQTTFATLFGAISGLMEIANDICESFIFPLVKNIGERITHILDSPINEKEKLPADKVKGQLIRFISSILKSRPVENEYNFLIDKFGAYFGPLIHGQLMKLRGVNQAKAHAQISVTANQRAVSIQPKNSVQNTSQNNNNNNNACHNLLNQFESIEVRPQEEEEEEALSYETTNTKKTLLLLLPVVETEMTKITHLHISNTQTSSINLGEGIVKCETVSVAAAAAASSPQFISCHNLKQEEEEENGNHLGIKSENQNEGQNEDNIELTSNTKEFEVTLPKVRDDDTKEEKEEEEEVDIPLIENRSNGQNDDDADNNNLSSNLTMSDSHNNMTTTSDSQLVNIPSSIDKANPSIQTQQ